jgi:hypothetical protein
VALQSWSNTTTYRAGATALGASSLTTPSTLYHALYVTYFYFLALHLIQLLHAGPQTASHIIDGYNETTVSHQNYTPWIVANIFLRDFPKEWGTVAWENVIYDAEFKNGALGYVVLPKGRWLAPKYSAAWLLDLARNFLPNDLLCTPTVVTYYAALVPQSVDGREDTLRQRGMDWDGWKDSIMSHLRLAHANLDAFVTRIDVRVLGHAMLRPDVRSIWGAGRPWSLRRDNVYFAHSDMSGLPLFEEACYRGITAARSLPI